MATTVYEVKELLLDDGSMITCKPANIKLMRKGNEMLSTMNEPNENDDEEDELSDNDRSTRRLLDIICLCLKKQRPEFETEKKIQGGGKKKVPNYDLLEELFDYETMFEVIHRFLGVKLNDPKLMEAMAKLAEMETKAPDGTNSDSQN